jgi:hypothetical protein
MNDLARYRAEHIFENERQVLRDLVAEGQRQSEKIYFLEEELRVARRRLASIENAIIGQGAVIQAAREAAEALKV